MKKEKVLSVIFVIIISVLIFLGFFLHNINKSNLEILNENINFIKALRDPRLNQNGTSYIGSKFYDFKLTDLNGEFYQLSSFNTPLKCIILFNINDCSACLLEYRLWSKLHEKFSSDLFTVCAICDSREKVYIENFIKNREIKFIVLWDPEKKVKNHMRFRSSPLRILLNKSNNILDLEHTLSSYEHQKYIIYMIESKIDNLFTNQK